jgi:hypothetical protein
MTTQPSDAIEDLQALLAAVEPSAAFVPAMRRQAAAQSIGSVRPAGMFWISAVAAGALMLLLVGLVRRHTTDGSGPPAPISRSVDLVLPSTGRPVVPEARESVESGRHAQPSPAPTVGPSDSSVVVVPAEEQRALVRLIEGLGGHRAQVPGTFGPRMDADGLLLPPEAVTIVPLPDPVSLGVDRPGGKDEGGSGRSK